MLIKKLSERIFFLAEKLHLPVDTRWLHCNISRRYTFNNDSRGNGKTVMTGSASLDTCKSATRALDSENIEANVARGAFLFFARPKFPFSPFFTISWHYSERIVFLVSSKGPKPRESFATIRTR